MARVGKTYRERRVIIFTPFEFINIDGDGRSFAYTVMQSLSSRSAANEPVIKEAVRYRLDLTLIFVRRSVVSRANCL